MGDAHYTILKERAVVAVGGENALEFLQGLVSNDIYRAGPCRAIYAALLTPQGKFLFDFFVAEANCQLLLDCEAGRADDLIKRLSLFKLRSDVTIYLTDLTTAAAFGPGVHKLFELEPEAGAATPYGGGAAFVDPRLAEMGVRLLLAPGDSVKDKDLAESRPDAYEDLRLSQGLPDGCRDIDIDKSTLLECGFEELHGVDFDKGCYMGQELTARTKYRGLVKRRLFPVRIEGPLPEPGAAVALDGADAGTIKSGAGDKAIALLRLQAVADSRASGAKLTAGDTTVIPIEPAWMMATMPGP
ncbi:MAG: folate-binding protein [Pseudomonadota bacterium]|nr:folate-binding protein [Pseudomonadota bacterium]